MLPILKWAGGKRWLAERIKSAWMPYADTHRYVEPFAGGLAVALDIAPRHALVNDVNSHLINFYRHVRDGWRLSFDMMNDSTCYYVCRARFNALVTIGHQSAISSEAAQLFYYLNKTGFNGLCRFNASGLFNVPFGRHKTLTYATSFPEHAALFDGWTFLNCDFEAVPLCPADFIYADPPYDTEFTTYSAGGFTWADQVRCADWLAAHRGPVIVSNALTDRIVDLYRSRGFQIYSIGAPRSISRDGNRERAKEMLATRNLPPFVV